MPEVKDIGTIIASREMEFIHENEEKAFLKVGMPFEYGEGYDWCCPYELSTESSKKLFSMFGIDALQSLELTMKILGVEVEYREKSKRASSTSWKKKVQEYDAINSIKAHNKSTQSTLN